MNEDYDILEFVDRYKHLVPQYVELARQIAPLLDKFGKIKKELEFITSVFIERGYNFEKDEPDALRKILEEELSKINETRD